VVKHFSALRIYRDAFDAALRIFDELDTVYEKVSGGRVNMMANAEQWGISSNPMKEC